MVRQKRLDVKISPSPSSVSPAGYHSAWLTFDILVLLVKGASMSGGDLFLLHLISWACCPRPSLVPLLGVRRQTPIVRSPGGLLVTVVPGKSHGRRSPVGCSPWGSSESGLNDFTFTFHLHALEKEMATHSSVLAWRIPGTGEP